MKKIVMLAGFILAAILFVLALTSWLSMTSSTSM